MKSGSARASLVAFFIIAFTFATSIAQGSSIRTVQSDDGSIIVVNTALGYSTILEFDSRPLSAVLGDSDSFKLEYVGNSITLKPLVPHAKSNLFVFTEAERFNCRINTVAPDHVDYIVRIHIKDRSYPIGGVVNSSALITVQLHRSFSYDGYTLTLLSKTQDPDQKNPRAITILDFELSSEKKTYAFRSASIGVKQGERYLTIESLYLDALEIGPGLPPVRGKVALLAKDFKPRTSVTLVFAVPDARRAGHVHRIEVATQTLRKPNPKLKKKGVAPWETENQPAHPQADSGLINISVPKSTPTPNVGDLELSGLQFAPSSF